MHQPDLRMDIIIIIIIVSIINFLRFHIKLFLNAFGTQFPRAKKLMHYCYY